MDAFLVIVSNFNLFHKNRACLHQPRRARSKHHTAIPVIPIFEAHRNCKKKKQNGFLRLMGQQKRNRQRRCQNYMPHSQIVRGTSRRLQESCHRCEWLIGDIITGLYIATLLGKKKKIKKCLGRDFLMEVEGQVVRATGLLQYRVGGRRLVGLEGGEVMLSQSVQLTIFV